MKAKFIPTRKRDIAVVLTVLALGASWWMGVSSESFRVRKLMAEIGYTDEHSAHPTGMDRMWFTLSLSKPNSRSYRQIVDDIVDIGEPAVPHMITAYDRDAYFICPQALVRIGTPSLDYLVDTAEKLDKANPDEETVRRYWHMTAVIGNIHPTTDRAKQMLLDDLNSSNGEIRALAAIALVRIDYPLAAEKALPVLAGQIEDPDPAVRHWTAAAMSEFQSAALRARGM